MSSSGNDPIRNLPLVTEHRDGNRRAATWQVLLTAFGVIAIITAFFWGINNQRDETAGEKNAATVPSPATPQGADAQQGQSQPQSGRQAAPSTTGQGTGEQNDQPQGNGQKTNEQPVDSNGEPAQRHTK